MLPDSFKHLIRKRVWGFETTITTGCVSGIKRIPPRQVDAQARADIIFSWTPRRTSSHSLIWALYECHPFLLDWSKAAGHWGYTGMRTQRLADGIASTHRVWVIALTHNSKGVNRTKLTNWGAEEEVKLKMTQYVSSLQKKPTSTTKSVNTKKKICAAIKQIHRQEHCCDVTS